MAILRLEREGEDLALVFRLEHLIAGAVRYARATYANVVRVDGWFGARWCRFAGTVDGRDVHEEERLALPPFAPKRVLSEAMYRRRGDVLRRIKPRRLHETAQRSSSIAYLDERTASCVYVWYSANSVTADRVSIMVYDVEREGSQRAWYAELQRREGVWSFSSTVGTSVAELAELETSYGNQLEPLFEHSDDTQRAKLRDLWDRALAATYEPDVAQAYVLIDQYRAIKPDDPYIGLLHAHNLVSRRQLQQAEDVLRRIENASPRDWWRPMWLHEWASLCELRVDDAATEAAHRELTYHLREETSSWICYGGLRVAGDSRKRRRSIGSRPSSAATSTRRI
jgi:hypothetical protein